MPAAMESRTASGAPPSNISVTTTLRTILAGISLPHNCFHMRRTYALKADCSNGRPSSLTIKCGSLGMHSAAPPPPFGFPRPLRAAPTGCCSRMGSAFDTYVLILAFKSSGNGQVLLNSWPTPTVLNLPDHKHQTPFLLSKNRRFSAVGFDPLINVGCYATSHFAAVANAPKC